MSTIKVDTIQDTSGNEQFTAKAWVHWTQGAQNTLTVEIRASGNVSSLTDNATGDQTITWSNAFSAATYACAGMGGYTNTNMVAICQPYASYPQSTTAARFQSVIANGTLLDGHYACVSAFE